MFSFSLKIILGLVLIQRLASNTTYPTTRNKHDLDLVTASKLSCQSNKSHRWDTRATSPSPYRTLLSLTLILAGDIQLNPGPRVTSIYPCGLCESPVTWNCRGVACDACSVWYHGSCIELCSDDYALLDRSNVQWLATLLLFGVFH